MPVANRSLDARTTHSMGAYVIECATRAVNHTQDEQTPPSNARWQRIGRALSKRTVHSTYGEVIEWVMLAGNHAFSVRTIHSMEGYAVECAAHRGPGSDSTPRP